MEPLGQQYVSSTKRRILITGCAGWLGSRLATALLEIGQTDVYGLVRPGGDLWRLTGETASVRLVAHDLANSSGLEDLIREIAPQVCFHLAWPAEPGSYLHSPKNYQALEASTRLACLLGKNGCERFVCAGTCLEYDTSIGYLSEDCRTKPASPYAAAKLAFQLTLEQIALSSGMEYLWARFFHLHGPKEDSRRLVPSVILSVLAGKRTQLSSGQQVRDYLHVDDAVSALILAGLGSVAGVINIGSGRPTTVAEVALRIGELTGLTELIELGARQTDPMDPPFLCANPTRLLSIGWRPTYTLNSGLANSIEWWRARTA